MLAYRPPWKPVMGQNLFKEASYRAGEFKEPLSFLGVGAAWTALDFLGHQALPITKGEKTPYYYYGNKFLWSIPFLLIGRLVSDYLIKGSPFVRAFTIGTTANLLMQARYLMTQTPEFNAAVFGIHEAALVPLSYLILGPGPATGIY